MRRLSLLALVLAVVWFVWRPYGKDTTPSAMAAASQLTATSPVAPEAAPTGRTERPRIDAVGRVDSPRKRHDARAVIAAGWSDDATPEHVAFRAWTERYLAAAPAARAALVDEGVSLMTARSEALARTIISDPEAALASAVPLALRAQLPAEVDAGLERRINARGELSLNVVGPAPGRPAPTEREFRAALIEGVEYRAFVYGRRAHQMTLTDTAISGIAVGRLLAVADSPVRLLEPGETLPAGAEPVQTCAACAALTLTADGAPERVAYQTGGRYGVAADAAHFFADAAVLEADERDFTEADNQPGSVGVVGRPSQSWTHGNKSVLLIRVDFPDRPGTPLSDDTPISETAAADLFNRVGGVAEFYQRSSFGKASVALRPASGGDSPDVTGVLRLARNAASYAIAGDNLRLHADARAAAEAAGFDVAAYDRVGVVFSSLAEISGTKITYGGLGDIVGPKFWINGSFTFRVVAHELGHTYGLRHSNLWKTKDGNPVSATGVSLEYGDPYDLMGGGADYSSEGDFSHWNKSILQWIPDAAVTVIEADGIYRVHRFDHDSADLGLPRALKIVRDRVRDYWIGYRRATDSAALDGGAYVLWGHNENVPAALLDLNTPGATPGDAPLALGATFEDALAGVTLRPVAQGGSGPDEWLDVQVAMRARLGWSAAAVLVDERRGVVRLTVRRTASATGALSVGYATENDTATAGVDYTAATGVLNWAAGDTADKHIDVVVLSDQLVEGVETFGVRLGTVSGGVLFGGATATVSIADAGARDTGFTPDFINSTVQCLLPLPDGGVIAGGFFTLVQTAASEILDRGGLVRLDASGAIMSEFDPGAGISPSQLFALARQADGRVLAAGNFTQFASESVGRLVRLLPDGSRDTTFDIGAGANAAVRAMAIQADGGVLIGGNFTQFDGQAARLLARLAPDGSLDSRFSIPTFGGTVTQNWCVESIALQPDGKILIGGSFFRSSGASRAGIARLLPSGEFDPAFDGVAEGTHQAGSPGNVLSVRTIAVQTDGRILIAGEFTAYNKVVRGRIARLSASGVLDTTFTPSFDGTVHRVIVQPDGGILVGGLFTKVNNTLAAGLARLRADGTVDTAFLAPGSIAGRVFDIDQSPDGRLWVVGDVSPLQGSAESRPIWRVLTGLAEPAGVLEFAADGYVAEEGGSVSLAVKRTGGSAGVVRVPYAAAWAGATETATLGTDFTLAPSFLEWADGDVAPKTITISVSADTGADDGESFTVRLGGGVVGGASLGARREAVVTIGSAEVRAQSIVFPSVADRVFGDAPFTLAATATSGLSVRFDVASGPATLADDSRLTLTGAGTVVVRATQAGSARFLAAEPVERSFTVAARPQTLSFPAISRRALSAGAFTLSATSDAGLPVAYEIVSGPATIAGAVITPTGIGAITVRAVQAGDATTQAAVAVEQVFQVTAGATVTLSSLEQTYAAAPRIVVATTEPADLAVAITYNGSTTPPTVAGTYAVVATVTDDNYTGSATGVLTVGKASLIVSAEPMKKILNAQVPALRLIYEGFAGADTAAVLDVRPTATTTATAKSKAGSYPVRLAGGADDNYALTLRDGVLQVVSVAAAYEALLYPGADATGESSDPIGLVKITVASSQTTFTGTLDLGAETAVISIPGKVSSPSGEPSGLAGTVSVTRAQKGPPTTYVYRVAVRPVGEELRAELYRDNTLIASGVGPRLLPASPVTRKDFAGRFTQRLYDFSPFTPMGTLGLPPVGSSTAVGAIGTTGVLTYTGRHADGRVWSGSATTSAILNGDYRFFARTYGARVGTYVAGELSVTRAGAADPTAPTGRVVWVKSAKAPTVTTENYPLGYAARGYSELRRWVSPTVPLGAMSVSFVGVDLGQRAPEMPTSINWGLKNVIKVVAPTANVAGWKMAVTPSTGAFTGSFGLRDTIPVPGKKDRVVTRTVTFAGALRSADPLVPAPDAPLGTATYMVAPLTAGQPTLSGELTITRP